MSLMFYVFSNYTRCNLLPDTADKIAITPKLPSPKPLPQIGKLTKYLTPRYTFHYLYHPSRRISWRNLNKYVNVVFHYFHRIYPALILLGNIVNYDLQVFRNLFTRDILPVLRYTYQVILKIIYGVLCPSYPHAAFIQKSDHLLQTPFPRLSASHFHPASLLAGIQWSFYK